MSSPRRTPVLLAFAAVYLIWGSTYLAIRFAVDTIPPALLMGLRSLIGGGLLYAWAIRRVDFRPGWRDWRESFLQGALFFIAGHGALAWAMQRVPSGVGALLFATLPAWMALLQSFGPRRDRPGWGVIPGLLLGIGGVAILTHPAEMLGGGAIDPVGTVVLMVSALSWVIGSLRSRAVGAPGGAFLAAGMNLLAAGVLLVLIGFARGESIALADVSLRSAVALSYMIGAGTILAFTSYLWLIQRISPTLVSTYAFVNPIVAVLLGWLVGGESLGPRVLGATVLMVASVIVIMLDTRRRERADELRIESPTEYVS